MHRVRCQITSTSSNDKQQHKQQCTPQRGITASSLASKQAITSTLRGGERVSRQPLCIRTVHASLRDVLCHGLEKTLCVVNTLQMQRVIAHRAPWQRVRNTHVVNAACHRASRTVAASEVRNVNAACCHRATWKNTNGACGT